MSAKGAAVTAHGWIYGVHDGLLLDLQVGTGSLAELDGLYEAAVATVFHKNRALAQ